MSNTVDEKAAEALQTKFNTDQIYHDNLPEHGTYPMVCYSDIGENPVLHADNALYGYEHLIRVTIVTDGNHGINDLKNDVYDCMVSAGFIWQTTNKTRDGHEYYTAMDFSIGVKKNE